LLVFNDMDVSLDRREQQILSAIVEAHVNSGEPVASRALSGKGPERLSPASIRNTMADLEERGLLEQPHASAGRVPTDLGYRVYVNNLMRERQIAPAEEEFIRQALGRPGTEFPDLLAEVPRVLSRLSHQIGLVVAPTVGQVRLRRIEFVRLSPSRVVAVIVGETGLLHNKVFETDHDFDQENLDRAGRYLTDTFQDCTLPECRERIQKMLAEEQALYDRLHRDALTLGRASMAAEGDGTDPQNVLLDGASNLLEAPEFASVERVRGILRTLDEKNQLLHLLTRCIEEGNRGVQVFIGSESLVPELERCTVVTSAYGPGGDPRGALGVIGPTRMEYAKAVALVDYVSRFFGRLLTR
jgi:heat-inducible transcriptional repressor